MRDVIQVRLRAALVQVYLRCFLNYLNVSPNSQESTLHPEAVRNSGNQHSSSGLLVKIGAALTQVYCWLTSTVDVFLNYLNVSSRVRVHVREASHHVNPIASLFQGQRLAKTVFGLVVPITELLLSDYKGLTLFQSRFIRISLSLGSAVAVNGMLLEGMWPRTAGVMEKLGFALIFIGYYGLISSPLPPALEWFCWLCFVLSCVLFLWSIFPLNLNSTSAEEITQRRPPV